MHRYYSIIDHIPYAACAKCFLCIISDVIIHIWQTTKLKLGDRKQPSQSPGEIKGSLGVQAPCAWPRRPRPASYPVEKVLPTCAHSLILCLPMPARCGSLTSWMKGLSI